MDLRCLASPSLGIVITGASGYIGRNLCSFFGSDDFESIAFEDAKEDSIVIHLAADVSSSREAFLSNLAIDTMVVDHVNERHKGLVYASTNNVYPYALDCQVNDVVRSNDYYATSKIFGENLLSRLGSKASVSLRIGDVFGPGQRHGNFFKAIELAVKTSQPIKLYGLGLKRRTYIHIAELCFIIKHIVSGFSKDIYHGQAINIGYADAATIHEIVDVISNCSGLPIEYVLVENDKSFLDIRTMRPSPLIEYKPKWTSFKAALTEYVENLKNYNGVTL